MAPDGPFADSTVSGPRAEPAPGGRRGRLRRDRERCILAGVAAGVAGFCDVDVAVVRLALVVLTVCGGLAVPLYVAGWLLIPEEGSERSLLEELLARGRSR